MWFRRSGELDQIRRQIEEQTNKAVQELLAVMKRQIEEAASRTSDTHIRIDEAHSISTREPRRLVTVATADGGSPTVAQASAKMDT